MESRPPQALNNHDPLIPLLSSQIDQDIINKPLLHMLITRFGRTRERAHKLLGYVHKVDEGNPYHDPKTGEFTTAAGAGTSLHPQGEHEDWHQHLQERLVEAVKGKKEIDETASSLGMGRVIMAPLKSLARAQEKIEKDYGGDADRITDLARNTIVVKRGQEKAALAEVLKKYPSAKVKIEDPETNPMGYSGILVKVPTNSDGVAEIQINTPQMMYAKMNPEASKKLLTKEEFDSLRNNPSLPEPGLGHKIYEEWRSSPIGSLAFESLPIRAKQYYAQFRSA